METIIGLLMVLLPVIFKVIGNRLEKAGQSQQADPMGEAPIENWAETVIRHLEQQSAASEPVVPVVSERVQTVPEPERTVSESVESKNYVRKPKKPRRPVNSSPILQEEIGKKREKIDPKKLIVYSEIMKPKYME